MPRAYFRHPSRHDSPPLDCLRSDAPSPGRNHFREEIFLSKTSIPEKIRVRLWVNAGGRCEYLGCNTPLWRDELTLSEMNAAYIAHIVADQPDGPRGDAVLSPKLAKELTNLMLLCDVHHRKIDVEEVAKHPVDVLQRMKDGHERRIELLTGLDASKKSEVILYGANIGEHHPYVSFQRAAEALPPHRYPATARGIALGMTNASFEDCEGDFWRIEAENLRRLFAQQLAPRLTDGSAPHLSIFAVAPQPLLILLGHLLSDIHAAEVYQLHREPSTWIWQEAPAEAFKVTAPKRGEGEPVLIISLSADVAAERVTAVMGQDAPIWEIRVDSPHNDMMRSKEQLQKFRETIRPLLSQIKKQHGDSTTLHVFPAMPVSAAIELGRALMPKADLRLRVYDQNKKLGGFKHALDVN